MPIRIPKSAARKLGLSPSPAPKKLVAPRRVVARTAREARAASIADRERSTLAALFPDESGFAWVRRFSVPYSPEMSKNRALKFGKGVVYKDPASTRRKGHLANVAREALGGLVVANAKLWIDLIVQKPNVRCDAVNVLDLVADALQDATGLNDRWYAVRRIDWEVVGSSPRVLIGLAQEAGPEASTCERCQRVLPVKAFGKDKSARLGVARRCKECVRFIEKG